MSVRCITQVFDRSIHAGTELLMLIVLADYSDDEGNSYPAVASLARKCRMKPRNANYILKALQESGELRVLKNEGPKGCNRYRIMLASLGAKPLQYIAPLQRTAPLQPIAPTPAIHCAKPLQPIADEPSLNRQEPPCRMAAAQAFVLPDWIPRDTWKAYCSVRTGKRAKNEPHALGLILKDLEQFRSAGHDPLEILNSSIKNGWAGVFEPRSHASGKSLMLVDKKPWEGAR